jgi:hypothetical protein
MVVASPRGRRVKRLWPEPRRRAKLDSSSAGAGAFFTRKRSEVQHLRRPPTPSFEFAWRSCHSPFEPLRMPRIVLEKTCSKSYRPAQAGHRPAEALQQQGLARHVVPDQPHIRITTRATQGGQLPVERGELVDPRRDRHLEDGRRAVVRRRLGSAWTEPPRPTRVRPHLPSSSNFGPNGGQRQRARAWNRL